MQKSAFILAVLLLGYFILQLSNGLQGTLLAVRADIEGFGSASAGAIMSGFFAGMCLGSFRASRLIARAGHIRVFAALASVASAAALIHLLVINPVAWIVIRTLTGFCFAGLIIVVESWLNASVSSAARGRLLSIYAIVGLMAGVCGQLLFGIADPSGYVLFVVVSIGLSLALVPVALSSATAPPDEQSAPPSLKNLWRTSPFGLVATGLNGATIGAFFGLVPIFASQLGFGASQVGLIMAAGTMGGVAFQYPLGWLSDRVPRREVSIVLAIVASLSVAGISMLEAMSLGPSLLAAALVGAVLLPSHSIVVAHVNDRAPAGAAVAISGGLILAQGVGAASGPLIGGYAMDILGPRGLLYCFGVFQVAIAVFGIYRIWVLEAPEEDARGDFVAVPVNAVDGALEIYGADDEPTDESPSDLDRRSDP